MKQDSNRSIQLDAAKVRELFHSGTRKEFVAGVRLALRQILAKLHVEGHYDQVITLTKQDPYYRELNNTWEELQPAVRSQKWQELMERLVQIAYGTRPYCLRCGECCHLGSPSLHLEDAELLSRGVLSTRQIYTLRRGEPVKFNIEGRLGVLPSELIKIKQHQEKHHCIFYGKTRKAVPFMTTAPFNVASRHVGTLKPWRDSGNKKNSPGVNSSRRTRICWQCWMSMMSAAIPRN